MNDHTPKPENSHGLRSVPGAEETAYDWDVATDSMQWEPNAVHVLGMDLSAHLATGTNFSAHMTERHAAAWRAAIFATAATDGAQGAIYRAQYALSPSNATTAEPLWIDETGRWWPGSDGRPARVRGIVRIAGQGRANDTNTLYPGVLGHLDSIPLTEALASTIARSELAHQTSAFLLVAVNNLAAINTSFGPSVGNELIDAIARLLKSKLKAGDVVGTYASDKFGIILSDCGARSARATAERLREAVRSAAFATSVCELTATASIGAVMLPTDAKTAAEAMSNALHALDQAKANPAQSYADFKVDPTQEARRKETIAVASGVLSALEQDRMRFVFQPIVSAETGEPILYECLLRMTRPDGSVAAAGEFISIAERLGMAHRIDLRTLELAIALLIEHPLLRLALNVSGFTANDHGWVVALHRLTGGRREIAQRLTIEITETALVEDIGQTAAFIDILRELGCEVAIDDFGAGYTSFRHLKTLKIDMLKIDGAFVKDLPNDHQDRLLIKAMVEMANAFGLRTVAEWVGDEATATYLRAAGVTYLQGFYFGMPISVEELARLQNGIK